MTIKFDLEHDVQTVYATLTDPDFLVERCLALGELSAECEVEEGDDETVVSLVREIQRDLPGFLARVFGSVQVTEMRERWVQCEEGWRGAWTLTVQNQPVTVFADFELLETPHGCFYSVSHRARAVIPLLSNKVEKFILGQTSGGATDELNYLKDYLARGNAGLEEDF